MPVVCPITFPALSSEEFRALDYAVMGHAFASHRELGRLADETIYQTDLAARLLAAGIPAHREVPVTASSATSRKRASSISSFPIAPSTS